MPRMKHSARSQARRNPVGIIRVAAGGYGFVDTPEGEFFIPANKMGYAFDGDTVEVKPVSVNRDRPQPGKPHNAVGAKPTARVTGVVERAHPTLVGRYEVAEPFGIVIPQDSRIRHDIFTMHADNPGVHDGDVVRVRIMQYPARNAAATGVVEEVVGRADAQGLAIDAIVAAHNLRAEFPLEVLADAGAARPDAESAIRDGYVDLRDRCVFTIDPPDARDFDDALSIEPAQGGWLLGVHIADVSWYVRPGSTVDSEARLRATSVYLADRVLPMIPEALSNGVCSLAPGEDRRCLTVDILLDDAADVRGVEFYPAVIRSDARLDYGQVQVLFDGAPGADAIAPEVAGRLSRLRVIARALKAKRAAQGALDLESSEVHMLLDADGTPTGYTLRRSTEATELVESCMVLANALVAQKLCACGEPAIYRIHDMPDPAALASVVPVLQELGYDAVADLDALAAGSVSNMQRVLAASRGGQDAELVSMLLLRAMKRAVYACECTPHFGLAIDEYLHFTSPIRRYPDLVAHRALRRCLNMPGLGRMHAQEGLETLAEHASAMERTADEAAWESQMEKLVEYLAGFVGRTFEGVVSRVAAFGFFVRLDNTATGLVDAAGLGEPYALDVRRQVLVGQDTGRMLRLGQRVRVVLVAARPESRELDFELAD